nr:retrovirus-related Pol polyprotein from transposon TNT 1-94 [Tanacetum cinerariifolium]
MLDAAWTEKAPQVPIFCDNTSAIAILNNPVLHSRTKNIDTIYDFIKDHVLKGDIKLHFIPTQYQLDNIFTKPLDEPTFKRLIVELEAFIRAPTQYKENLSEFWYTAKTLDESKIWVSTLTCGIRGDIGYTREIKAKGTLKKSCLPPRWRLLEDIIHKLSKKTREKVVPYPRFISLLLEYMMPKYDNEELTINSTQEVPQGKKPGAKNRLRRKQSLKHTSESKTEASKSKTGQSKKETHSSLAKDKSPSHPLPATLVVGEMHKEAQQAAGSPTSLGAATKEGATLSSCGS